MSLRTLATTLATELGPPFHLRSDYDFVIPARDGLSLGRADVVIFSSAVPSIHTAAVGFHSAGNNGDAWLEVDQFAYLGAPLLVSETQGDLSLYKFSGARAEKIVERQSPEWVRNRVLRDMESPQLRLPFAAAREILIQDTRDALEKGIVSLMTHAKQDQGLDESDAFSVAMAAMRKLFLPDFDAAGLPGRLKHLVQYAEDLASRVSGRLSFANVPAESIAELYEKFAVDKAHRDKHGVVYTPAWLARYVVDKLPADAFSSGTALDPACGSGTFLVCFLERVVERAAREGKVISAELLKSTVSGIDIDPVAIEAARLSLDMFVAALGTVPAVAWDLSVDDATVAAIPASQWLIGNLPFGYRTHKGRLDISGVIFEHIHDANPPLKALSLILPGSLAYASSARSVRSLLRTHYNMQEVTQLPEGIFASSMAATMVVNACKGLSASSVLIRRVREKDLPSFRAGVHISSSFYADFPPAPDDPWHFSPFSNEFGQAVARGSVLGDVASTHLGLQIYGVSPSPLGKPSAKSKRPLLIEPSMFATWGPRSINALPTLTATRDGVRRSGPWDKFQEPKVIIRATTAPETRDRLAALPDTQGVWFTDKFVGVWPKVGGMDIRALAAYLQTRFVRAWFESNNPSRKLRVRVLASMPIPKLAAKSWERAAVLAPPDRVIRPPQGGAVSGFLFNGEHDKEWAWFNASVDAAFGLDPISSSRFVEWFASDEEGARVKSSSAWP